jgi:hypothetical protein
MDRHQSITLPGAATGTLFHEIFHKTRNYQLQAPLVNKKVDEKDLTSPYSSTINVYVKTFNALTMETSE